MEPDVKIITVITPPASFGQAKCWRRNSPALLTTLLKPENLLTPTVFLYSFPTCLPQETEKPQILQAIKCTL